MTSEDVFVFVPSQPYKCKFLLIDNLLYSFRTQSLFFVALKLHQKSYLESENDMSSYGFRVSVQPKELNIIHELLYIHKLHLLGKLIAL